MQGQGQGQWARGKAGAVGLNRGGRTEGGGGAAAGGGGGAADKGAMDDVVDADAMDLEEGGEGHEDGAEGDADEEEGGEDGEGPPLDDDDEDLVGTDVNNVRCKFQTPFLIQNGKAVQLGPRQIFYRGSHAHPDGPFGKCGAAHHYMVQLLEAMEGGGRCVEVEVGGRWCRVHFAVVVERRIFGQWRYIATPGY